MLLIAKLFPNALYLLIDQLLFFLLDFCFFLDSVHILKCIRNNWLNQKSTNKSLIFPQFQFDDTVTDGWNSDCVATACFDAFKQLHLAECNSIVKFSYRLSMKALHYSIFERQNVTLALQIFNNFTSNALTAIGQNRFISVASFRHIKYKHTKTQK